MFRNISKGIHFHYTGCFYEMTSHEYVEAMKIIILLFLLLLFILTANGFLPGGSGITIRHNTHHTNNTPCSNKTQHTKLHKQ
jgi:hypothetical protein